MPKILHSLAMKSGCGLFGTAEDLMTAERGLGADVAFMDPTKPAESDKEILSLCDVIIDSSGLTQDMIDCGKPVVLLKHARPHSSFLIEHNGGKPVYTVCQESPERYSRVVTMWELHIPYLQALFDREDIDLIDPPVDLDKWTEDGPVHDFGELSGAFNVVCADPFRKDVDPYHVIAACALLPEGYKLHVAGFDGGLTSAQESLVASLGHVKGQMFGWANDCSSLYRAADLVISPQKIAVRTIREATACGIKTLADLGNQHALYTADAYDAGAFADGIVDAVMSEMRPESIRAWAEAHMDSKNSAKQLLKIVDEILE